MRAVRSIPASAAQSALNIYVAQIVGASFMPLSLDASLLLPSAYMFLPNLVYFKMYAAIMMTTSHTINSEGRPKMLSWAKLVKL